MMEHNPHDTPGPESQAPIIYPSGYCQDDTFDIVMAPSSTSTSPSLGIYDDISLMGSGFYPQRYGGDHVYYQRNRSEEDGNSVDPRLMRLLEFFRQLFIRRRELLNRMFPGLQDECVEVCKKVGNMLHLRKPGHEVVTLRRSLSIGSGELSSSLRPDRFKVRTVTPVGGTVAQGGGDDDRRGDKTSGGSKSK
ncbi:hypothetical protein K2173_004170 [Erythroxylum novogranatense]|uniref:Uncharacterized protein n=1 Tax=Erythroxylum novogranatense TaxID=1862640 RepID=A0AAV8SXW7_9ROSI|nr:hypothetical protein K2173_004170 [Erythroxylum novogranatense]